MRKERVKIIKNIVRKTKRQKVKARKLLKAEKVEKNTEKQANTDKNIENNQTKTTN